MTNEEFLRDMAKQLPSTHPCRRRLEEVADKLIELGEWDRILTALENGGVDNWEWFEASLEDAGL